MLVNKECTYIGNIDQLLVVKQYTFSDGKRNGVKAIDISNSSGLEATILLDKCMDIYQLKYKGKNLNFITPTGIVAPSYYNAIGTEWFRSWEAGFFTTCGLTNIGIPSQDDDESLGLHGRIHNIPAENINVDWQNDDKNICVCISGNIKQAVMFGENLVLHRKIYCDYKSNNLKIEETITNQGYRETPLMLLYHFNIGYPLLSENAQYVIPSKKIYPRDDYARTNVNDWREIKKPQNNFREMCYYHELEVDDNNICTVGIDNPKNRLFLRIEYDHEVLDKFIQWKMFGKGEYVTGLEPCNSTIDGRDNARKNGDLKTILPGQSITYKFNITITDEV